MNNILQSQEFINLDDYFSDEKIIDGKIYKITNLINGKIYIGQTIKTVEQRFKEHCIKTTRIVSIISRSIQKYGKENFRFEQIDSATTYSELNQKEYGWIVKENCLSPNGYNLRNGGNAKGISEETRQKMIESRLNCINNGAISPFANTSVHQKCMETRVKNHTNIYLTNNPMKNEIYVKKKVEKTSGIYHYARRNIKYYFRLLNSNIWEEIIIKTNLGDFLKECGFCSGTFFRMINDPSYRPHLGNLSNYEVKREYINENKNY